MLLYCVERRHVTSNENSCTWWQNKDCMLSHLLNRPYRAVLFDLLLFRSSCYSMMSRLHTTMFMHLLGLHRDIFSSVSIAISIWHFLFRHFVLMVPSVRSSIMILTPKPLRCLALIIFVFLRWIVDPIQQKLLFCICKFYRYTIFNLQKVHLLFSLHVTSFFGYERLARTLIDTWFRSWE